MKSDFPKNIYGKAVLYTITLVFISSCLLISYLPLVSAQNLDPGETQEDNESINPLSNYTLDISCEYAMVVEIGRGMRLYMKNHEERTDVPVAVKIMTAVIAIESISSGTTITISNVAAREPDADTLSLRAGEKYPLDYLLYGLLLKDNNAAAIALAEQVRGTEDEFVKLMNERAETFGMDNTRFINSTGEYDENQYTTMFDTWRLVRYALTLPKFQTIIQTKNIPFFISYEQTKHIRSNFELHRNLVPSTTGGIISENTNNVSFIATASESRINTVILSAGPADSKTLEDLDIITNSVFYDYELTTLVSAGQSFPRVIQLENDSFGLRFNNSVNYVRPRDSDFIKNTFYEENEIIDYPILTSDPVAKVTFELLDGTRITVDLYPDKNIYGSLDYFHYIVQIYNENRGIANLIIALSSLLILLCVIKLITSAANLIKNK